MYNGTMVHVRARSDTAPTQPPSMTSVSSEVEAMTTATAARRPLTRDEVMTASEVAELLHLPVSTVYQLARQGKIPARRLGRTWRFLRPNLEQLLRS